MNSRVERAQAREEPAHGDSRAERTRAGAELVHAGPGERLAQARGASPQAGARERLARAQEELARALGLGAPVPEGLDAERVLAAARSLMSKRRRQVERIWPALAESLGADFASSFEAWAREHPMTVEPNPWVDGRRFAESPALQGRLTPRARKALQGFDAHWRITNDGELLRRWSAPRVVAWLRRWLPVGR